MRVKFQDKRPKFAAAGGYHVPNENIFSLEDMVKKAAPKISGGICSAGEVPLFVLLPNSESVIAVDHSYFSLRMAISKALLLEHHSTAEIRNLLSSPLSGYSRQTGKLPDAFDAVAAEVPKESCRRSSPGPRTARSRRARRSRRSRSRRC